MSRSLFSAVFVLLAASASLVEAQIVYSQHPGYGGTTIYPLRSFTGELNYSTGATPYYLGNGYYEYGPTSVYHPYMGWYRLPATPFRADLGPAYVVPQAINRRPVILDGMPEKEPRTPTSTDVAQSRRLVEFGDARFADGQFAEALRRYRAAAEITPDVAEIQFRKGFAAIATKQYEVAAESIQRAVRLAPNWQREPMRLDQLYGGNTAAKTKHLEAVAAEALRKSNDTKMLTLVGMFLHFDGQAERAAKYLDRAEPPAAPQATTASRSRPRPHVGGEVKETRAAP